MTSIDYSDSSSVYSMIMPTSDTASVGEQSFEPRTNQYVFPQRTIVTNYQMANPYAKSLWFNTRGEVGNGAIDDIKKRVGEQTKRKLDELPEIPPRLESLESKKVDSPIKNEKFLAGFDDVECDSPKYKGMNHLYPETKYSKAFKELIVTELKYRDDLKLVDTIYRSILHNSKKYKYILSKEKEATIFGNFETIVDLSSLFLKEVQKLMEGSSRGYFEFDIRQHFQLIDSTKIDIGDILKTYFIRLKFAYTSYFQNHKAQINELDYCTRNGGPKVEKWLQECAFLAKGKCDSWDLESLLIKPIQRLPKYLLLIDSLLTNSGDDISYEYVEHLYDAKTYLEKMLDGLNSKSIIGDDSKIQLPQSKSDENHTHQYFQESRSQYVELVKEFKLVYTNLKKLKKEINESVKPLIQFAMYQKDLAEAWKNFMEYEDNDIDDHYIKSIYSSYYEKICDQQPKLLAVQFQERIVKAIDLSLDQCQAVKVRIKKHNSNRAAYVEYMKTGKVSYSIFHDKSSSEAQDYIVIENQIKDGLPPFLEKLRSLTHYISLLYNSLILDWLASLAGEMQLKQYQEALKDEDIVLGDNFDIIELYSNSKHHTKLALKDLCSESPRHTPPTSGDSRDGMIVIHSSRVVRRLFGV